MPKDRVVRRIDLPPPVNAGFATIESQESLAPPAPPDPPAPTGLGLTTEIARSAVTPTTRIIATWSAPLGVDPIRYALQWSTDSAFAAGATSGTEVAQPSTTDTVSATIDGLRTSTLYYVRVAAVYRERQSAWTTASSITTASDTTAPDPPAITSAAFIGAGDLRVRSTPPTSTNYRDTEIAIYSSSAKTTEWERVYDTTGEYIWTATQNRNRTSGSPDAAIYIELRARSWSGVFSSVVSATVTKSAPATPASVTTDFTGVDAVWTWGAVADAALYRLTIDGVSRDVFGTRHAYTFDQNRAEHSGTADAALTWSLVAVDALDQASASASGTATNAAPSAPASVAIGGQFALSVSVTYTEPADFLSYTFRIIKDSATLASHSGTSKTQVYNVTSRGTYQVGVTATDAFGQTSAETLSSATVIDFLTVEDLRKTLRYTDSIGTAAVTLDGLKDTNLTTNVVTYASGTAWKWTEATRELTDRYQNITVTASGGVGYIGVSADGSTYSWYSGPLGADGRTLTAVASEAAAQTAAVALPTGATSRLDLPAPREARYIRLGHRNTSASYSLREFYPRRLVEADDIRVQNLAAISADMGSITAGTMTGVTIQTATSGERIVLTGNTLRSYDASNTEQVTINGLGGGALTAGGSNVLLDSSGMRIVPGTSTINQIRFKHASDTNAIGVVQAERSASGTASDRVIVGINHRTNGTDFATLSLYLNRATIGSSAFAADYVFGGSTDGCQMPYGARVAVFGGGLTVGQGTAAGAGTIRASADIYSVGGWFRSFGSAGWHNDTHGGGVRMPNADWVEIYGSKNFHAPASVGIGTTTLIDSCTLMVQSASSSMIGLNAPAAATTQVRLYKDGVIRWAMYVPANSNDLRLYDGVDRFTFNATGLGIGVSPSYRLELPNVANTTGQGRANAWVTYSSARWKHNVRSVGEALQKVRSLRGVYFEWGEPGGASDVGMIAEEVEKVVPELVTYDPANKEATIGLKYDRTVALLVEAVKELAGQVSAQTARAETQQQRADTLEQRLNALTAQVEALGRRSGPV